MEFVVVGILYVVLVKEVVEVIVGGWPMLLLEPRRLFFRCCPGEPLIKSVEEDGDNTPLTDVRLRT